MKKGLGLLLSALLVGCGDPSAMVAQSSELDRPFLSDQDFASSVSQTLTAEQVQRMVKVANALGKTFGQMGEMGDRKLRPNSIDIYDITHLANCSLDIKPLTQSVKASQSGSLEIFGESCPITFQSKTDQTFKVDIENRKSTLFELTTGAFQAKPSASASVERFQHEEKSLQYDTEAGVSESIFLRRVTLQFEGEGTVEVTYYRRVQDLKDSDDKLVVKFADFTGEFIAAYRDDRRHPELLNGVACSQGQPCSELVGALINLPIKFSYTQMGK